MKNVRYRGLVVRVGSSRIMRGGECRGWSWSAQAGTSAPIARLQRETSKPPNGWSPCGGIVVSSESEEEAVHGAWENARRESERLGTPFPGEVDVPRVMEFAFRVMCAEPDELGELFRAARGGMK